MYGHHLVADFIQGLVELSDCIVNLAPADKGRCTIVRGSEIGLHDVLSASCVGGAGRNRHGPVGCSLTEWDRCRWRPVAR